MTQREPFQTETLIQTIPEESWMGGLVVKNILCPVDFSVFSLRAFRYAIGIARHFQARSPGVHLLQGQGNAHALRMLQEQARLKVPCDPDCVPEGSQGKYRKIYRAEDVLHHQSPGPGFLRHCLNRSSGLKTFR